jgi:hypothetical protein
MTDMQCARKSTRLIGNRLSEQMHPKGNKPEKLRQKQQVGFVAKPSIRALEMKDDRKLVVRTLTIPR